MARPERVDDCARAARATLRNLSRQDTHLDVHAYDDCDDHAESIDDVERVLLCHATRGIVISLTVVSSVPQFVTPVSLVSLSGETREAPTTAIVVVTALRELLSVMRSSVGIAPTRTGFPLEDVVPATWKHSMTAVYGTSLAILAPEDARISLCFFLIMCAWNALSKSPGADSCMTAHSLEIQRHVVDDLLSDLVCIALSSSSDNMKRVQCALHVRAICTSLQQFGGSEVCAAAWPLLHDSVLPAIQGCCIASDESSGENNQLSLAVTATVAAALLSSVRCCCIGKAARMEYEALCGFRDASLVLITNILSAPVMITSDGDGFSSVRSAAQDTVAAMIGALAAQLWAYDSDGCREAAQEWTAACEPRVSGSARATYARPPLITSAFRRATICFALRGVTALAASCPIDISSTSDVDDRAQQHSSRFHSQDAGAVTAQLSANASLAVISMFHIALRVDALYRSAAAQRAVAADARATQLDKRLAAVTVPESAAPAATAVGGDNDDADDGLDVDGSDADLVRATQRDFSGNATVDAQPTFLSPPPVAVLLLLTAQAIRAVSASVVQYAILRTHSDELCTAWDVPDVEILEALSPAMLYLSASISRSAECERRESTVSDKVAETLVADNTVRGAISEAETAGAAMHVMLDASPIITSHVRTHGAPDTLSLSVVCPSFTAISDLAQALHFLIGSMSVAHYYDISALHAGQRLSGRYSSSALTGPLDYANARDALATQRLIAALDAHTCGAPASAHGVDDTTHSVTPIDAGNTLMNVMNNFDGGSSIELRDALMPSGYLAIGRSMFASLFANPVTVVPTEGTTAAAATTPVALRAPVLRHPSHFLSLFGPEVDEVDDVEVISRTWREWLVHVVRLPKTVDAINVAATKVGATNRHAAVSTVLELADDSDSVIRRGAAALPEHFMPCLSSRCLSALEESVEASCEDIARDDDSSGILLLSRTRAAVNAMGIAYLRSMLIALRWNRMCLQVDPQRADDIATFLAAQHVSESSPPSSSSGVASISGADLPRALSACVQIVLTADASTPVQQAAFTRATRFLVDLARAVLYRSAEAFPITFSRWWSSLGRGSATEVEDWVARRLTPILAATQLRSAVSEVDAVADDEGRDASDAKLIAVLAASGSNCEWSLISNEDKYPNLFPIRNPSRSKLVTGEVPLTPPTAVGNGNVATFRVRCLAETREVIATYTRDDVCVSLKIALPPAFPLRRIEVTCEKRMGVPDDKWRSWELQIKAMVATKVGYAAQ